VIGKTQEKIAVQYFLAHIFDIVEFNVTADTFVRIEEVKNRKPQLGFLCLPKEFGNTGIPEWDGLVYGRGIAPEHDVIEIVGEEPPFSGIDGGLCRNTVVVKIGIGSSGNGVLDIIDR